MAHLIRSPAFGLGLHAAIQEVCSDIGVENAVKNSDGTEPIIVRSARQERIALQLAKKLGKTISIEWK